MSWTFRDEITNFVTRLAATARRRRDNVKKKSHHHCRQKIARVAAALEQGLGLRLLRRSFSSSGKKVQRTKTEMNLNSLRDE